MKTKNRLLHLFLAAAIAGFAGSAAGAMYKWTDKEGKVHYTETPPDEGNSTEIAPPPRVAPPPANAQQSAEQKGKAAGNNQQAGGDAPLTPEEQEIYRKNCEVAKGNMEVYKVARRIKQADGEYVVMDDENRQQKMQQAEEQIKKFCR